MRKLSRTIVLAGGMTASLAVLAYAAETRLDVKPGLWEMTTNPHVSGTLPIPEADLARLPPDRRAKIEAAMQASMARAAKPRSFKECLTLEKLAQGFHVGDEDSSSCKRTVVSSSPSLMEVHEECSTPDGSRTGTFRFQAASQEAVSGSVKMSISRGGKTMTLDHTIEGRWLGADCGSVKTIEFER